MVDCNGRIITPDHNRSKKSTYVPQCLAYWLYRETSRYEPSGAHRSDTTNASGSRKSCWSYLNQLPQNGTGSCRTLSVPQGFSAVTRNRRKARQADRASVIATFQVAESRGTRGEFRQSDDLPRVGHDHRWRSRPLSSRRAKRHQTGASQLAETLT